MPKWAKKALDVTSTAALVIFIVFVILLVGVRVFGIEPHIVLSGSMEPEILTGSMVYVDKLSPDEAASLQPGDTVTYQVDHRGTKVTHKIYNVVGKIPIYETDDKGNQKLDDSGNPIIKEYAKDADGNEIVMYTTYGINNVKDGNVELSLDGDPEVGNLASSNVIGKAKFSIPFLGYIAHFVQNPPGKYLVLVGCVMLIFMTFFANGPADAAEPQPVGTGVPDGPSQMQNEENGEEQAPSTKCEAQNEEDEGTQEPQSVGTGVPDGPPESQSDSEDKPTKTTENDN